MAEPEQVVDVSITAGDPELLARLVRDMVDSGLVACGNIIPGVRSIYRWDGAVQDDPETLAVLHTRRSRVDDILAFMAEHHPDETPQVIATAAVHTHPGYQQWVIDSTR
ncbi:divalent-cation tolerance protein CutA [Nocardia vermiculata]|uniref:Divalent-cation tolerance protein CutA n=1 Tax=Nocardia vermiculata TaxID=257274 RepID=A0A846XZJ2_9NOCA|nr:divalent-cation tolerance protein CutA [Nocardia vermiculata]NKY52473.1 divalent-cation tolerance protein CutA [Nocardia vermiculata]